MPAAGPRQSRLQRLFGIIAPALLVKALQAAQRQIAVLGNDCESWEDRCGCVRDRNARFAGLNVCAVADVATRLLQIELTGSTVMRVIDRSFVRDMVVDSYDGAIVAAIVSMARSLSTAAAGCARNCRRAPRRPTPRGCAWPVARCADSASPPAAAADGTRRACPMRMSCAPRPVPR